MGSSQALNHQNEILEAQLEVVREMYDKVHTERDELKKRVRKLEIAGDKLADSRSDEEWEKALVGWREAQRA